MPTLSLRLLVVFLLLATAAWADDDLISDGTRSYFDLGGDWNVLPIDGLTFQFPPPGTGDWKKETEPQKNGTPFLDEMGGPYCPAQGVPALVKDGQFIRKTGMAAWFKHDFTLPKDLPPDARARLYFGGLAFKSEVWLNGKKLGESMMGLLPISYDVTGVIQPGANNELVVGLAGREGLIDLANKTFLMPSTGVSAGIWGKVELQFIPTVSVDDIFVKPNVKDNHLDVDVTLLNAGTSPANVQVRGLVTDAQQVPETQLPAVSATIAAGESKVVTLSRDWMAPVLWSPVSPALYFARVEMARNGTLVDAKTVRFGCRSFEIRGHDFYLNDQKTVFLRNSWLAPNSFVDLFPVARSEAGNPINAVRLHTGFDVKPALDACDELGFMCMPESSWHNASNDVFALAQRALWLPNVEAYQKELIKENRNRPSVVMWNLTNETFWGSTKPEEMEVADGLVAAAKEADPTRPVEGDGEADWGGRLSVINIHYPESSSGNTLRDKYPDSGFVFPNDTHWLVKDGPNLGSMNTSFKWDRPLIVGEYWFPDGDLDHYSAFMGESIYDWEKWAYERLDGRDLGEVDDNPFVEAQEEITDGYRMDGAAGVNPWGSNGDRAMPAVCVRPVDFFPNFQGGKTSLRKFVVLNDSARNAGLHLQCRLTAEGRTLWHRDFDAASGASEPRFIDVPINCPVVARQLQAELSIRLCVEYGNAPEQLNRYTQDVFIMPPENLADLTPRQFYLLDQSGNTAKALTRLGLNLTASPSVTAGDLQGIKVLIVGENTDLADFKSTITDFVEGGGAAIVLRQDNWSPLSDALPDTDKQHVSTRSWLRSFDHPITAGLDDRQLSYWRPDHLVSRETFRKPVSGAYRVLVDTGGAYGMRWASLVEIPSARGTFVLSSQPLVDRVGVEPMADRLLANMLRYAAGFHPAERPPLRLLAGTNAALRAVLQASRVDFQEGLEGKGPVLVDASADLSGDAIAQLKSYLAQGGKVWIHGFSPDLIARVRDLFPFQPELQPYDPAAQSAIRRSNDPILDSLSSFDFFWTRVNITGGNYFDDGHPTAKLGGWQLKLPAIEAGVPLLEPALLVKVPVGKGTLLYDSLIWEGAFGPETDKVTRIVSSLAANLGANVKPPAAEASYAYSPVDISKQANMGYYDQVADDGRGGWTDQGDNDMRFFLINHTGRGGGLDSGMEVEAQPFPTRVTMAGRQFTLLDPRKTSDHAIISLRGQGHGMKLPASALGIPVGKKADKLWFLQACGWTPAAINTVVANYVIHYQDGSAETFPIRYGREISEWWNPRPLPEAKVAWTGRNLEQSPIGIYVTEWANPHPDKEIASLDFMGDLSPTQVVLLAVTSGVSNEPASGQTTISAWQMGDFASGKVPNQISGEGALIADAKAPTLTTLDGLPALHFHEGQALHGDLRYVPDEGGVGTGKPFSLKITVNPDGLPSGYCGGLFEASDYGSAGFRLVLGHDMKLWVDSWDGTKDGPDRGLGSVAPLELGQTHTIEVRFDGKYGVLLLDGKIEKMKEMPLPKPYNGPFNIGVAGGVNYYFNGTIKDITLSELTSTRTL